MAEAIVNRVTPPVPAKARKGYVPAAQRKPVSEETVIARMRKTLDRLPRPVAKAVLAYLSGRYLEA